MELSKNTVAAYEILAQAASDKGICIDQVKDRLKAQHIETPSWGYADSGTRFHVFKQAAAAKTVWEKLDDAAVVHKLTGVCPSVALHIPWDFVEDWTAVTAYAKKVGLTVGAINPNLFQEEDYLLGSLTNPNPEVRQKALDHCLECVDIMRATGSKLLSLWLADGTNYPGQGSFRARKHWLEECLSKLYAALDGDMKLLIEYKFFEPAFYHTDIGDWGMATAFAQKLGPNALTLVDLGHHPLGTNIEHIVAFLIDEGRLGGFHFNAKKYADDDLTVGSINPYELFLIYNELVAGEDDPKVNMEVAYMIDQSHNEKPKIEAMIQSVMHIQSAYAKALLIDRAALTKAQDAGDIVGAERILLDAYDTDVRPLLAVVRAELGCAEDPLVAYKASGYAAKVGAERAAR